MRQALPQAPRDGSHIILLQEHTASSVSNIVAADKIKVKPLQVILLLLTVQHALVAEAIWLLSHHLCQSAEFDQAMTTQWLTATESWIRNVHMLNKGRVDAQSTAERARQLRGAAVRELPVVWEGVASEVPFCALRTLPHGCRLSD